MISIITAVRNGVPFVAEAVASALGQPCDLELVVADGASTDGTREILAEIGDPRLRWISEPDGGQSAGLNKALAMARGDVVGWLNADDRYAAGSLARVERAFAARPALQALYGDLRYIDAHGRVLLDRRVGQLGIRDIAAAGFCAVPSASLFLRRELAVQVGGFNERLRCAMDYDFILRVALRTPLTYLPGVVGEFRVHAGSTTSRADSAAATESAIVLAKLGLPMSPTERLLRQASRRVRMAASYARTWGTMRDYCRFRLYLRNIRRRTAP